MYTADKYARARAQLSNATPEERAILQQRIHEYEVMTPQRNVELSGAEKLATEIPEAPSKVNVPELPPEAPAAPARDKMRELAQQYAEPAESDPNIDLYLPNASKRKDLETPPPEYVAKNPLNGIKHIMAAAAGVRLDGSLPGARDAIADQLPMAGARRALDAPQANTYREPSVEQFLNDQAPWLRAQGIPLEPGNEHFEDKFAEYKDRKWKQAYLRAEAADQPLTRAEYVQHSQLWDQLKDTVANVADAGSAFGKGFARAATLHGSDLVTAVSDKLTGRDDVGTDRAQIERRPVAEGVGELVGAATPGGPLARVTEGAAKLGARVIPGIAGRLAGAAVGGATGAVTDLAGRSVAQGAGDLAHGRTLENAKDNFTSHLLGAGLLGGGLGLAGGALAEGAGAYRRFARTGEVGRELRSVEAGGGATGLIRGVTPPKSVSENIEAARPAVPGETKLDLETTPEDLAAGKLHEPLTAQNAADNASFRARAEQENAAMYAADPSLQKPRPMTKTADAVVDLIKARSLPEAEGDAIPGAEHALPARNNKPFIDLAKKLFVPRLVTSVEAADAARAAGGRVITLEEANALDIPTSGLAHQPQPETGVPLDAPPIPDEPAGSTTEEIFGRPADKPTPYDGRDLGPRVGRAKPPPAQEPGSDWDSRGRQQARFEHVRGKPRIPLPGETYVPTPNDDVTRVSNSPPIPTPPAPPSSPSGPPPELRSTPAAQQAQAAGVPPEHLRVVLEPRALDAQKYEEVISALDDAAKAGRTSAEVDPAWKDFQRAVRQDREQFSPAWADLKDKHYREQLALEQRAGHANIRGNKPYSEMDANAQKGFGGTLKKYGAAGADKAANDALRSLADSAGPKVRAELETLRAQTAFGSLKQKATPNLRESAGAGGIATRVGGLGTAAKLRTDAAARGLSRGPMGTTPGADATVSPELMALIRSGNPIGREYKPAGAMANMFSMGKGALGMRAGVAYNSLSPADLKKLQELLAATDNEDQKQ